MPKFLANHYIADEVKLIVTFPSFDHDSYPQLAEEFVALLSAKVVEKQQDADLHTWLIDFEGCRLMLRGEHYSESVWLESLSVEEGREELEFIASLLSK
ncbi:aminopeptidase N [Vibrio sp. JCM 19236]|nr:aminopeptidase N [Vibrio sp. JCM 19236]